MVAQHILLLLLATFIALVITVYMYGYKSKLSTSLKWILGILRFFTLLSVLILLINPKITSKTYTVTKPTLSVLVDNSASIKELKQDSICKRWISQLKNNTDLQDKFSVSYFQFGSEFKALDSLTFSEKNTQITKALKAILEIVEDKTSPVILLTDGNQTLGSDYSYVSKAIKHPVFPIVFGDTTKHSDLKIEQLNTNKYSFLNNKFPVEAILTYSGDKSVTTQFTIKQKGKTVFKQPITFTKYDNVKTIFTRLPASKVGLQTFTAALSPIPSEQNTANNYRRFAVEIIDQSTKILVVSDIVHPDLGTLKKAIETNKQRTVFFKKPSEVPNIINDYQLVILYQPTGTFSQLFKNLEKLNKNYFLITGKHTKWDFLNAAQKSYYKEVTSQTEEVTPQLNPNYSAFAIDEIGFSKFPPLETTFGALEINTPNEVILEQYINGYATNSALLATTEENGKRTGILDGEGLWKWRAYSYLEEESFQNFDDFMGKIVQYLASNKRRSRLEVSYKTFYYNNNVVNITAQYFDKNYEFDKRASLNIVLTNKKTKEKKVLPMLLNGNFYQVDLSGIDEGDYLFTVSVKDENLSKSGSFTLLDYNVEKQFLAPDVTKLTLLATNTGGRIFYPNQYENLINQLLTDNRFKPIEKVEEKTLPLIHWKILLSLIVLLLFLEWFIRKYNGLI